MDTDRQSYIEDHKARRLRYSQASKQDLELLAVSEIKQHRHLFAADQSVYEAWERTRKDLTTAPAVTETLWDEYMLRRRKTAAQQERLAHLLDVLGYVPDVPVDT